MILKVGTFNSTGQRYRGHFSIWITNAIQEHLLSLQHMLAERVEIYGWINGNLYVPTKEVIGILPIPIAIRQSSGMAEHVQTVSKRQRHHFLAAMQGTRKPVLPIHSPPERQLFHKLMKADPSFSPQHGEPRWKEAVKVWNANADESNDISYKVC